MKCPKCGSEWAIQFETKYTKKGFWCDECGNEWVIPNTKHEWEQLE